MLDKIARKTPGYEGGFLQKKQFYDTGLPASKPQIFSHQLPSAITAIIHSLCIYMLMIPFGTLLSTQGTFV